MKLPLIIGPALLTRCALNIACDISRSPIFDLVFNNNDKIKNSYINNYIVIILKKRKGGKYAMLLGDFALNLQKTY